MSFNPTSPVTGAAITGFTAPTYTLVADQPVDVNARQFLVSALGGTQVTVRTHAASDPFTISMVRPKVVKPRPYTNASGFGVTGVGPKNDYTMIVRKGILPLSNVPPEVLMAKLVMSIPTGGDVIDVAQLKACLSLLGGVLFANAPGILDSIVQNNL